MNPDKIRFAPREVFEKILEFSVIPTFDLVIWCEQRGVILLRRRIAPYKNTWALPGLRMMKPEGIDDTLVRIAHDEVGVAIDPASKMFIGQYVGRFKSENQRQDLSTCYSVKIDFQDIRINQDHFSGYRIIGSRAEIPVNTGAMYRYYLNLFFNLL